MRITAKVDYAVRAVTELAAAQARAEPGARASMKGEALATAQGIPVRFLETILSELRRAGIVGSQRGSDGGYWLARPADSVSVADVIRAVEGPLADVHGAPPEEVGYVGPATELQRVCIARGGAWRVFGVPPWVAEIASGALPLAVTERASQPDGWARR
jgi:Rrf2 family protein